ncbi:MAG TPA: tRNA (guanosine(37)-N1)-methyltransferase TrmD [Candidatus Bipolaricaulis anaerobius]|nr:tRNA (guanosine(37)-N1)-methyltransferase TrmD [Candidatus Bipolaricaulis anaerobius]MDD5763821.1 tRNA (guanosine(37)-N1)-methyltransferase TrmD [Candidatus Bipolaricaulis anaerobius]HNR24980.1 tRNA (guanosine(37)-N1)-methyltransferase TrmD [Candidatus Bipolaricaulis anaerobius]HNS24333.1 tRNA (guanosine(37)-N1)-methyltransferase TrmD [Candidatus Bipolaricaulis anaerobius]
MRFDVVTLHPEMLLPFAAEGILRGAQDKGLIEIHLHDLRLFSPEGGIVDDRPFGGGAGMVMRPEPFARALAAIGREGGRTPYTVLLSAQGVRFSQEIAHALARERAVALLCGRYEGVDERVAARCDLELSIGDYVLAGGELAAAVVLETTARMVPGVVGRHESAATDSFYSGARLGYPQYTRPRVFQGMEAPAVLLSGDHEKIRRWREREAWRKTLRHRPDLVGLNLPPAERGEAP